MAEREAIETEQNQIEDNIDQIVEETHDWSESEAQEAEGMGWIPPDRSKKLPEGKTFLGPKEFMERNPLYSRMKTLESSFGQLTEHYQKASERDRVQAKKEYDDQIVELKAQKVQALDDGDNKAVVDIDEALRTIEKPEVEAKADPVFDSWVAKNSWYSDNDYLSVQADIVAQQYLGRGLRGKDLLDTMAEHMKKAYPDQFKSETPRPAAVESGSRGAVKKTNAELTEKDLTPEERTIYRNFEKMGSFPKDEHKQQYFKDAVAAR